MAKKKATKKPNTKAFKASEEMGDIEHQFQIRNDVARKMRENIRIDNSIRSRPAKPTNPRKKTGAQ